MNEMRGDGTDGGALLVALFEAAGSVHRRLDAAVEAHGLSLAKMGVLEALVAHGGSLPLGRVADALECVRSNVTQLVDRLEADGLVRRAADPEDRRSTQAVITEEGRQRLEAAARARAEAEAQILAALPADRRAELDAMLNRLGGASM